MIQQPGKVKNHESETIDRRDTFTARHTVADTLLRFREICIVEDSTLKKIQNLFLKSEFLNRFPSRRWRRLSLCREYNEN